ncbi:helix-turn-helix transcriptional regulator [Catenulispora sp. NL8]|uniref:Helix-turn-helix transcriptional regulator n=1 Tax=Catenulispora pinistramenti TaxID=2705254 RepID=A0ABS5KKV1_9ACTN|nr:metalloregulator ArsR/SmtB family transcription factor [Catenulispora pinistramenti]MBS2546671.1 helix-turn-helix transcriptional regulator [Catenulispora pinistramenti]
MRDAFHADPADVPLAAAMHALSDPLRLRIVALLARDGETECSVIYSALGISKSNASHHFRILRESGLIWRSHQGRQQSARLRGEEFDARFPGLLAAVLSNIDSDSNSNSDGDGDRNSNSNSTADPRGSE